MTLFLIALVLLTLCFLGVAVIIQRKVITANRGGFLIVLSGVYFCALFYIAYLMRENFK